MTDLDRRWDLPSAPEDLLYQAAILSRFFPALAVHLRSSLGGLYLAADSLAPEEARDFNARMDQDKSVLDLNYYRLLRLTGNLSLAADMDLPQDLPEEDRDIVEETELVCRETESLAKLLGLTLCFRCQEGRHLCALRRDAVRQLLLQLLCGLPLKLVHKCELHRQLAGVCSGHRTPLKNGILFIISEIAKK